LQTDEDGETLYFPQDFTEVERVIGSADVPMANGLVKLYMVKWVGLPYFECSWETREDLGDDQKIQQYLDFNTPRAVSAVVRLEAKLWLLKNI